MDLKIGNSINTPRCHLRRFTLADHSSMMALEQDPLIMRFTPQRVPQTKQQTLERLSRLVAKEPDYAPFGVWAAETAEAKEFIGWFMLIKTDLEAPELGFMVTQNQWGKGYTQEVCKALIDFGFNQLKCMKVMARTDSENFVSIHILQKLGFHEIHRVSKFDATLAKAVETVIFELNC